uniref:Uncharacterized protein n=1 Tax=Anguilla anguilla TaxID=7936 RepID=A0A0E9WPD4_ANGAN
MQRLLRLSSRQGLNALLSASVCWMGTRVNKTGLRQTPLSCPSLSGYAQRTNRFASFWLGFLLGNTHSASWSYVEKPGLRFTDHLFLNQVKGFEPLVSPMRSHFLSHQKRPELKKGYVRKEKLFFGLFTPLADRRNCCPVYTAVTLRGGTD